MLKKISIKKILTTSIVLFAITLLYILPADNKLDNVKQELEYVSKDIITHSIYLLDSDNYIAKTEVIVKSLEKEELAKYLVEVLIKDGIGESSIPSGFKSIIDSNTIINKIEFDNNLIKIDFNDSFLATNKELEEKMIEALIFTLTDIEDIDKVQITVDGKELKSLPISKKNIPNILDRSFGINKEYDIKSSNDITSLTLYYINKYNDDYYYVPVTKYINNSNDKIEVIIEELKNPTLNSNLMSFMNDNTELVSYTIQDKVLNLEFNDGILANFDEKEILEEVIYTISMSMNELYDLESITFNVNNEEIKKSNIKSIDCD